jgi:hypothetical protein
VIAPPGNPRRQTRRHVCAHHRAQLRVRHHHRQWTAGRALHFAKCRQQSLIGPARSSADLGPKAKVLPRSAYMRHGIDAARAAEHPSARPLMRAAGRSGLRRGAITPIVVAPGEQRPFLRNGNIRIDGGAARLEDGDSNRGIFAEPRRKHAARGPAPYDEYIGSH